MSILHCSDMVANFFVSSKIENLRSEIGSQNHDITIHQSGRDFFYVSQDNYYIADLENGKDITYYCDSATSCIIIFAVGKDSNGNKKATISHLSRPGRFEMFFSIAEELFENDRNVHIYASGANPPSDDTADRNAKQVTEWVSLMKSKGWKSDVSFGKGDPSVYNNNLDCYSLHCDGHGNINVSNDRIYLTVDQRDPTGGLQTLFCVFGDENTIRLQTDIFSESEIVKLVEDGKKKKFDLAATMDDDQILKHFSSTPQYEVPWFCDTIRQAGLYVKNHMKG